MEIILSPWLSCEQVEKFSSLHVERLILRLKLCLPLVDLTDGFSITKNKLVCSRCIVFFFVKCTPFTNVKLLRVSLC